MAQFRQENSPSYKDSCEPEILDYVGEPTLSIFTDHMRLKYNFNLTFQIKISNREEWVINRHLENMLGRIDAGNESVFDHKKPGQGTRMLDWVTKRNKPIRQQEVMKKLDSSQKEKKTNMSRYNKKKRRGPLLPFAMSLLFFAFLPCIFHNLCLIAVVEVYNFLGRY